MVWQKKGCNYACLHHSPACHQADSPCHWCIPNNPWCSSHALQQGTHALLPPAVKTLPQLMGERGYYTGNIKDLVERERMTGNLNIKEILGYSLMAKVSQNQPFFAQVNSRESTGVSILQKYSQREDRIPPYYPDHPVTRNDWPIFRKHQPFRQTSRSHH